MSKTWCEFWTQGTYCGATEQVVRFNPGRRCPAHTPAALAGRPEVRPDPALTLDGRRAAAGADPEVPMTPASPTVVDQRAIASGKRRSNPADYAAARAAVHGPPR